MIEKFPTHIAIIPDGNRRWATLHGVPALEGHRRGADAMHAAADYLIGRVQYLTVWGFSTDNWKRSDSEVSNIFHLLAAWIETNTPWANKRGIQLRHIGRLGELPHYLKLAINQAVELTKNNSQMTLNVAFNYSGRAEIVDAVRRLINAGTPNHWIPPREINEAFFSRYLDTADMPDVDLVIRTAGELRPSNFMLWQIAYSEFYFTDTLWPDFNTRELEKALVAYSERKRRFGGD